KARPPRAERMQQARNTMNEAANQQVLARLTRIEATLTMLVQQQAGKDYYTTDEVARILGKAEFTVREWCRLGRVRGEKKGRGRGEHQSWVLHPPSLPRIQKGGLV